MAQVSQFSNWGTGATALYNRNGRSLAIDEKVCWTGKSWYSSRRKAQRVISTIVLLTTAQYRPMGITTATGNLSSVNIHSSSALRKSSMKRRFLLTALTFGPKKFGTKPFGFGFGLKFGIAFGLLKFAIAFGLFAVLNWLFTKFSAFWYWFTTDFWMSSTVFGTGTMAWLFGIWLLRNWFGVGATTLPGRPGTPVIERSARTLFVYEPDAKHDDTVVWKRGRHAFESMHPKETKSK